MDREIILRREVKLSSYRKTIVKYLPFVLVKSSKYTNSKRLSEFIAVYTFISVYRLTELLDGFSMPCLIEMMSDIVGEDLGNGTDTPVRDRLSESEDALIDSKTLTLMSMDDCMSRIDSLKINCDYVRFNRIISTVLDYLIKSNQHLTGEKRHIK